MAKVIVEDPIPRSRTWNVWLRTIVLGAVAGLVYWFIALLIDNYIVEPLACRQMVNAAICTTSDSLSGNIAAIMTAALGVLAMVRAGIIRPILVAGATLALLWSLGAWTSGLLLIEVLGWSVLVYALSYALFSWIARYTVLAVGIIVSLVIVLTIRIAIML